MPKLIRTHRGIHARQLQDGSIVWDIAISHAGIRRRIGGFLTKHEAIRAQHYILAAYRRDRFLRLTLPSGWDSSSSTPA
jgi:hypothetical protein